VEIRPDNASYIRLFYGSWNFGAGTFSIGQQWDPGFTMIYGCCAEGGRMPGFGTWFGRLRAPMVKLGLGSLQIALIDPNTRNIDPATFSDVDQTLPALSASYSLNAGPAAIKLWGGYNTYDVEEETAAASVRSESVDSYVLGIQPTVAFGPLTIRADAWMAQNPTEYGLVANNSEYDAEWDAATLSVHDVDAIGYGIDLAYKISDMYDVRGGWGTSEFELDCPGGVAENDVSAYYVNFNIRPAKGVVITPEFAVRDYGDWTDSDPAPAGTGGVAVDQGKVTYYGVYWYIGW
jgi:hypothetical protein